MKTITKQIILLVCILIFVLILPLVITQREQQPETQPEQLPFETCLVINLVDTNEGKRRWELISKHPQLKHFVTRYPGIHGATYDYTSLVSDGVIEERWDKGKWKRGRSEIVKMSPGEIGCILSHYFIWRQIVEENIPVTMVLEDDAIAIKNNLLATIATQLTYVPADWDIFLLGFWMHTGNIGTRINSDIYKVKEFALTHSYLITLKGAHKLLSLLPINMPLDTWMSAWSEKVNIYRHTKTRNKFSTLIRQKAKTSEIFHTNNWK